MKIGKIVRAVKRQIRAREFGTGKKTVQLVLTHPDPGFRRAARAPMCLR